MTFNKAKLKEWVAALRSDRYQQGQFKLRSANNKFCCLGVVCDLSQNNKWNFIEANSCYMVDGHANMLPSSIRTALGIDIHHMLTLTEMNDTGKSFDEIADYIEERWINE